MSDEDKTPYGCPACGYTSDSEEDVENHMTQMADDPKHQEYDLKMQDDESENEGDTDSDAGEESADMSDKEE